MMNRTILAWYCAGLICKPHSLPDYWMPVNYCNANETFKNCKSEIELNVGNLTSDQSNIEYKYDNFDFCKANAACIPLENLGQTRFNGEERVPLSPYKMEFLRDVKCATVCRREYSGSHYETINRLEFLKRGIALDYYHHWTVDNIPVTWCYEHNGWSYCVTEIPMGTYYEPDTYYLFNHVDFTITYSRLKEESNSTFKENGGRIISVTAVPRSIKHGSNPDCKSEVPLEISNAKFPPDQQLSVTYTYSVKFENNTLKWSSRWYYILESMIPVRRDTGRFPSSLITVLFLSGIVAVIMCYTLPIIRYKQVEFEENPRKESGWRVIRNDVFRPPRNGLLLSALLGSGVIIFLMIFVILVSIWMGFCITYRMKSFLLCAVVGYACLSSVGGYVSAVLYKSFSGKKYKWNILLTSLFTPSPLCVFSVIFSLIYIIAISTWMTDSQNRPFAFILIAFVGIWFGVSVPMTLAGAYFGFKEKPLKYPVATNEVDPRPIPNQSFFSQTFPYMITAGIVPQGFSFIQSFFTLQDLLCTEAYYITRFLLTVFLFVITYSEITVLLCYFHLSAENYNWWWHSFSISCPAAFYMLMYCMYFIIRTYSIKNATSMLIYILLSCIIVIPFFLLMSSIGFFACFWFVRRIYSVEKDFRSSPRIKLRWFRSKTAARYASHRTMPSH